MFLLGHFLNSPVCPSTFMFKESESYSVAQECKYAHPFIDCTYIPDDPIGGGNFSTRPSTILMLSDDDPRQRKTATTRVRFMASLLPLTFYPRERLASSRTCSVSHSQRPFQKAMISAAVVRRSRTFVRSALRTTAGRSLLRHSL